MTMRRSKAKIKPQVHMNKAISTSLWFDPQPLQSPCQYAFGQGAERQIVPEGISASLCVNSYSS